MFDIFLTDLTFGHYRGGVAPYYDPAGKQIGLWNELRRRLLPRKNEDFCLLVLYLAHKLLDICSSCGWSLGDREIIPIQSSQCHAD